MSKDEMKELGNTADYDGLYRDAKQGSERHVYKLLSGGLYDKLSPDAKKVLDMATELVKKSMAMRKEVSEEHPEYHLDSWDCGWSQIKLVTKEYFKEDHKAFREAYKAFEDRLRPLVYQLGFLRS